MKFSFAFQYFATLCAFWFFRFEKILNRISCGDIWWCFPLNRKWKHTRIHMHMSYMATNSLDYEKCSSSLLSFNVVDVAFSKCIHHKHTNIEENRDNIYTMPNEFYGHFSTCILFIRIRTLCICIHTNIQKLPHAQRNRVEKRQPAIVKRTHLNNGIYIAQWTTFVNRWLKDIFPTHTHRTHIHTQWARETHKIKTNTTTYTSIFTCNEANTPSKYPFAIVLVHMKWIIHYRRWKFLLA